MKKNNNNNLRCQKIRYGLAFSLCQFFLFVLSANTKRVCCCLLLSGLLRKLLLKKEQGEKSAKNREKKAVISSLQFFRHV